MAWRWKMAPSVAHFISLSLADACTLCMCMCRFEPQSVCVCVCVCVCACVCVCVWGLMRVTRQTERLSLGEYYHVKLTLALLWTPLAGLLAEAPLERLATSRTIMTTCLFVCPFPDPRVKRTLQMFHTWRQKQALSISGCSGTANFTLIHHFIHFLEKLFEIPKRKEVAYSFKINKIKRDTRHFELSHLHVRQLSAGAKISFYSVQPPKRSFFLGFFFNRKSWLRVGHLSPN